jgi:hypothetical protein
VRLKITNQIDLVISHHQDIYLHRFKKDIYLQLTRESVTSQYISRQLQTCNRYTTETEDKRRACIDLEYKEGGPAEAAQQDHEDAHEPAAAAVAGAVRDGVAGGVLRPREADHGAAEEYHEQRSPDSDQSAGDLRLAPPLPDVYSLHPMFYNMLLAVNFITNLSTRFLKRRNRLVWSFT